MNHYPLTFAITLFLFFLACTSPSTDQASNTKVSPIDSTEAALPHGASLPETELSDADKHKLAHAKGRTVTPIAIDSLGALLEEEAGPVQLINFWNLNCMDCRQINSHLLALQRDFEEEQLQTWYINMDSEQDLARVNAYIREYNFTQSTYQLIRPDSLGWESQLHPKWNGQLPALWVYNPAEGINLLYQQSWTFEELSTIIQPFMIR